MIVARRGERPLDPNEVKLHVAQAVGLEHVGALLGAGAALSCGGLTMKQLWARFEEDECVAASWLRQSGFLGPVSEEPVNIETLIDSVTVAQMDAQRRGAATEEASGEKMALRLECFNSVDGSSRLIIVFGWLRFVCANGLIIGETMIQIRERHDGSLALDEIPNRIEHAFLTADADRARRLRLQEIEVAEDALVPWVDGPVAKAWGKKVAARILHICRTGHDGEFDDPFASGEASEKPIRELNPVPGSIKPAKTAFDVMQAMSYVATGRKDALERHKLLRELDNLLGKLKKS